MICEYDRTVCKFSDCVRKGKCWYLEQLARAEEKPATWWRKNRRFTMLRELFRRAGTL
jgi:hypothetical protein